MRIVTNTKLAKRNKQYATYMFFITFAVLIGGFFLVNASFFAPVEDQSVDGLMLLFQASILPIALILTLVSIRMTNLWVRQPRPEVAISEGLKGLSKKSVLYNYYHIPARHVLFCPQGVFVIYTRWHDRHYIVQGDKWSTKQGAIGRVLSALRFDGIGNPTQDALRAKAHLEKLLKPIAPDVEVKPVIIFVDPRAELTIEDPTIPVMYADARKKPNLTDFMRDINREIVRDQGGKKNVDLPLTDKQIEQFEAQTL